MRVTDHAMARYLTRTGGDRAIRGEIRRIVEEGRQIVSRVPVLKLLNNNFEDADYYELDGVVAVVSGSPASVLTVMSYDKSKWKIKE